MRENSTHNKNSRNLLLQLALLGPLRNYVNAETLKALSNTNKALHAQLKNTDKVSIEFTYTVIKKAFFFRAFVLEFLHLWNGENNGDNFDLLNIVYSGEIMTQSKLTEIDKILTKIIVDGVKKIKSATLLALLRNDPHFESNPDAVFDTLKLKNSQNDRKVSGKRTLHIVRSMLGGDKPISYLNLNKWTFKLNSPIAKIVNLGKNQSFQTFLRPQVTAKSVKAFLYKTKLKKTNVQSINMNNIGVYRGSRLPQGNRATNSTPNPNNNTSSLNEIRKALGLSRNQIANFISKQYPGFNQNKNVVPRKGFMSSNQNKKAHAAAAARKKGKMPMGLKKGINYSKLFN